MMGFWDVLFVLCHKLDFNSSQTNFCGELINE